jgi:serine/threonine-protein kinase RsbW
MAEPSSAECVVATTGFAHRIWPAEARWLGAIRAELRGWLAPLALTEDDVDDVVLAVNEAASNSIEHAYAPGTFGGTVELSFWTEPSGFCVHVLDHGRWRIPSGRDSSRGRGIVLMRRLMTAAAIEHDGRGTRVLLSMTSPLDDVAGLVAGAD